MDPAIVDRLRNALLTAAQNRLTEPRLTFATVAIEEYCAAYRARLQLADGTITSYSIQGRSITKRNIADIPLGDLYADLAHYLPPEDLPKPPDAPGTLAFDFAALRRAPSP